MDELKIAETTDAWNFLDGQGRPLRFNYHALKHDGECLPTVKHAIPAVWENRKADYYAYYALRQWINEREEGGLIVFLLASIRCLTAVARSTHHGGDPNGDNMGIAIEAAFDEINSWPDHDPNYTDGIDFFAEPTFLEPGRPSRHGNWLTYFYIRWVKRAAIRAIKSDYKERRRRDEEPDLDDTFYGSRTRRNRCEDKILVSARTGDVSELVFDREVKNEIDDALSSWNSESEAHSWLADWLDENVSDPIEKTIVKVKQAEPWRTHAQVIESVNAVHGTTFRHDKVSKCLKRVETEFTQTLTGKFGFRPTISRTRMRAPGIAPIEPPLLEIFDELPTGMLEAAAQYELDEDGYKIGPKILSHPNRLQPNRQRSSATRSA